MTDTKDTTTMTGAEFQRHVGTDAAKWAEAFVRWTARGTPEHEIKARVTYVMPWFRDFAEVKVAEALRGETEQAARGSRHEP